MSGPPNLNAETKSAGVHSEVTSLAHAEADSLPINVLIVDDEPKNLSVLETVLDDPGYRLIRAGSGSEALMALMAHEFAVLVLDVRMPDMTGFELAQIIKQRKKTAQVPIIFLTAYFNEDQHIIEGYTSGAVDYLHKPVNTAVLRTKVSVFADLHRKGYALERANAELANRVAEQTLAESRLSELNASLEKRVADRTAELRHSEARLKEANYRKDEFLATLAHELRNPLAPMRHAVQVLRMSKMAPEKLKWASGMIDRQVYAMSRLIDDLMDVSRINQGKIELRLERVDLASVLAEAVDSSRPLIDDAQHHLTVDMPRARIEVNADTTRLAQVFLNLLNNAAKYMDQGGAIAVKVETVVDAVSVSIKDEGIGIQPDRLEMIFGMFSQVETALSRSRGGLGIGLSLTQRLIEMHGGTVTAASAGLGQGSTFTVTLPLVAIEEVEPEQPGFSDSLSPSVEPMGLRVLVADDNKDSAIALAALLDCVGAEVNQAHDGAEAVQKVLELDPQLVLLDIGMPKLNGYEACRQIRANPGGEARTIVAITGWGQPTDREASGNAGFDRHLVKPVDPELVFDLLNELANQNNVRLSSEKDG